MKLTLYVNNKNKLFRFNSSNISMYLCGPTVYNDIHIGNARPIIIFDVLNKLLKALNYKVNFLHNITDIDDKIIAKANEKNESESTISNFYYLEYMKILKRLNIATNFKIKKVTDNIYSIIDYIELIYKNGFAYDVSGDVYFDTSKVKDYGLLSGRDNQTSQNNSRIDKNDFKKNQNDFVLWKKTTNGLYWSSTWSNGRPGWHTECSCLINKYLGKQIDIHGGGIDLKFPHHENENAQNIAVNHIPICKVWLHIGHLNVNNEKMSKSENNFHLVKDVLSLYSSNAIRWFFYQTSYSNPLDFSWEILEKSKNEIEKILYNLNIIKSHLIIKNKYRIINNVNFLLLAPLCNNLNFPNQISMILKEINNLNSALNTNLNSKSNKSYFNIIYCLNLLGIKIVNIHTKKNIELLLEWNKQKNRNNYIVSDKLRKRLFTKKLL